MTRSTDFSDPARRIIVALDVSGREELLQLIRTLRGTVGMFKVGKQLFTALGPEALALIKKEGGEVFLDLKFHDIPNTVAGAVRAACRHGVAMLTVHASGGRAMLEAAVQAAREMVSAPLVIGATVLTSLGAQDLELIGLAGPPEQAVLRLGGLAIEAGLDGLVASARELTALRAEFGKQPFLVTPGIRPKGAAAHDQQRVATPLKAVSDGADFLVIGRPITRADDPLAAVEAIVDELVEAE
ncbi:MAG: orotidine-5'-phosphate decarboxylase [Deltaproteobacteria bacterium]|nr:orotidine-5'-phosphate decarboxylase [Deltaproteobacteria bacterium]